MKTLHTVWILVLGLFLTSCRGMSLEMLGRIRNEKDGSISCVPLRADSNPKSKLSVASLSHLPRLITISPPAGKRSGGTTVVISGRGFVPGVQVYFGDAPCVGLTLTDPNTIKCFTSGHTSGNVDVVVVNPDTRCDILEDSFRYTQNLVIYPKKLILSVGDSYRFTSKNGYGKYQYAILNGDGTVDAQTGLYTASTSAGGALVRVQDERGEMDTATVQVNPPLKVSVFSNTLRVGEKVYLSVTGGVPPYSYSSDSNDAEVDSETGLFKALRPSASLKAEISDAMNHRVSTTLKIVPDLSLGARYSSVFVGNKIQLEVNGGVAPFTYSVVNGTGTVDSVSGELTIGEQAGLLTVKVTDSVQNVAFLNLQVYPAQRGSPISASFGHTCAVEDGSLRCWGDNRYGQLGDGTRHYALRPTAVDGLQNKVASVSVGARHSCALLMDGSVRCWGDNSYGQLGVELIGGVPVKSSVIPLPVLGLTQGVLAIAAGNFHTCAIREGDMLCWGDNSRGQLGNTLKGKTPIPVPVQGIHQNSAEVIAGGFHTCALVQSKMKCWGANQVGQLGNGLRVDTDYPVDVEEMDGTIQDIYARADQTCALFTTGRAKCWGYNAFGQLGNLSTETQLKPIEIQVDSAIREISLGTSHTCVLVSSSPEIQCWGLNHSGQLSRAPDDQYHLNPLPIQGIQEKVVSIAAGVQHTCALLEHAVTCWGDNSLGQLGSRDLKSTHKPTEPARLN